MNNLKTFLFATILLFSESLFAQASVLTSQNIYNGQIADSYYILLNQDSKDIYEDLKSFGKLTGRLSEVRKNQYRIDKLNEKDISTKLNLVDIVFDGSKKHQKIIFYFLDNKQTPLSLNDLNDKYTTIFVRNFAELNQHNLDVRLANIDIKMIEDQVADARKLVAKTEKQLESNLKDQEKLGKKLDSSPDQLSKAVTEKEELIGKIYTDTNTVADPNTEKDFKRASDKKEKEIVKIQKEKEKAMSKLGKKESDFDELRKELVFNKTNLKDLEAILLKAVSNLKILENKR
jgi:hypothetical protein